MLVINLRARNEISPIPAIEQTFGSARNASHPASGEERGPQHGLHRLCTVGWILIVAAASPFMPSVEAQTSIEEVRALREEVGKLRQEMADLRGELQNQKTAMAKLFANGGKPPANATASSDQDTTNGDLPVSQAVPLLQSQVAELAQTKVESNSRMPVRVFGSIISNTFYNTGEPSWLDNPHLAFTPNPAYPHGNFSSTLRQSRLGAFIDGPMVGKMKSSALVELDFYGGIPNYPTGQVMGIPRLLYGYMRLEGERTAIEVGQDRMILAPRDPNSVAALYFPSLYSSGNLYLRVPQIRVEHALKFGRENELQLTGGMLAPVAGTNNSNESFELFSPKLEGERSRQPAVQARIAWKHRNVDRAGENGWELGFSGHHGQERFVTGPQPSWAGAIDFDFQRGRIGAGGEFFVGRNIDAFGGSLGRLAESAGGFLEGRFKPDSQWEFSAGFGTDQLFNFKSFPMNFKSNTSFFLNTMYHLTPEWLASFEYRLLSTSRHTSPERRNGHFNLTFAYSF